MKKLVSRKGLIVAALFAFMCVTGSSFAAEKKEASDKFYQGKQGQALDALEKTADKKAKDVKVPDVPKPTPVNQGTGNKTK